MKVLPEFVSPVVLQTGTLTSGSPVVQGLTTGALSGAVAVSGQGINSGTFVLSIDSPSQVTLTKSATSSVSSELTFGIEAVTLPEAKLQLRLEIPDDDSLVADLITTARMVIENHSRRAVIQQERTLFFDGFGLSGGYYNRTYRQAFMDSGGTWSPGLIPGHSGVITFPWPPLLAVSSVEYYDPDNILTTIPPEQYSVSPGNPGRLSCAANHSWPQTFGGMDSVEVNFVCGYPADKVPAVARSAIKLVITDLYENRGSLGEKQVYKVPDVICNLLDTLNIGTYM